MTKAAPSSISGSRLARALALTAAIVLAIDQGAGAFLDYVYARSSQSPVVQIALAAPQTLVLGSSTGKTAVDPQAFLTQTYNGAENGQSVFYVAAILRNLPKLPSLQRVVIALDPADFTSGYESGNLQHLWRVAPLGRQDPVVREWLALGDPWAKAKFFSGLFPYRGEADSVIHGWHKPRFNGDGFLALNGSQVDDVVPVEDRSSPAEPVLPEAQRALEAIAESGKRLGVQLVAVVTPMAGRLRQRGSRFAAVMDSIHATFEANGNCDLTRSHDPFLETFSRTAGFFWEGPHLNAKGAEVYSRWLAAQIERRCPLVD